MDLSFPSDQAVTGRTGLATTNWTLLVFPTTYTDITGGTYDYGVPGLIIDSRNTDAIIGTPDATRPAYTNDVASYPILTGATDNTDLSAPTSPGLWIGQGDKTNGGVIRNFVRLFPSDIPADPYDGLAKRGAWLQKVYTGENCSNTSYRYFLCTPCYDDSNELG